MRTIWKFPLRGASVIGVYGQFDVPMPFGARVLSVGMQDGAIMVWAAVEDKNTPEPRSFYIAGTGRELPPAWEIEKFIGMVQDGPYVWHVFEKRR